MHAMMAAAFHPCMALDGDEAAALAKALANVQQHYPNVRLLSDKHAAVFGLVLCGSRIYGKRAMIISGMMETPSQPEKAKPKVKTEPGSNVLRPEGFAAKPTAPVAPDPMAEILAQGLAPAPEPEPWGFTPPDPQGLK